MVMIILSRSSIPHLTFCDHYFIDTNAIGLYSFREQGSSYKTNIKLLKNHFDLILSTQEKKKTMIDKMLDIILVEDNPADVELSLLGALQEHNLANRVKVLRDGEEAVNYIFRQGKYSNSGIGDHPSVILLDLKLPKIDGLDILRRIRMDERTKAIPVVILTSAPTDQDRIDSYHLGVTSYIKKPVEFNAFAKTIAKIGFYWAVMNQTSD